MGHSPREATLAAPEAQIGDRLKRLREAAGLSLRTLATRAGFSASFLSQLENGLVSPSIASLERIARELGVTLADFFEASHAPAPAVIRAGDRPGFTSVWSRARVEALVPSGARRSLEAVAVTLSPRGASGRHAPGLPTDQFAYVLKGPVSLSLAEERLTLGTGDAVVIPRKTPHRWQNDHTGPVEVLLVATRISH
jgi:transcriptional regulator with XRE-family HTH domain